MLFSGLIGRPVGQLGFGSLDGFTLHFDRLGLLSKYPMRARERVQNRRIPSPGELCCTIRDSKQLSQIA